MATIELYAYKVNMMADHIQYVAKSVHNYNSEVSSIMLRSQQINQSVCNTSNIIG